MSWSDFSHGPGVFKFPSIQLKKQRKVAECTHLLADFKFLLLLCDLGSWVCSGCKVKTPGRKRKGQLETPITSPPRRKIQPHSTGEGSLHG